jgi:hypothetical protein
MTLAAQLTTVVTRIGTEIKAVRTLLNGNAANLNGLNTTAKTNLVAAINEVKATADAAGGGGAAINDTGTSTGSVWSSSKTQTEITAAANAVIADAPGALNTLNELAASLGNDANFAGTVTTALANRVRYDAAQTLSAPQQAQACANIGVGDPATNFVTPFEAALV